MYFSFFAKPVLFTSRQKVIAVTGSVGKSSMVELFDIILKNSKIQYRYAEHVNSAIGIPLEILNLTPPEQGGLQEWAKIFLLAPVHSITETVKRRNYKGYYLVETDSDRPGELQHIGSLLRPYIVIWLNATITHSAYHDAFVKKGKVISIIESIALDFSQALLKMQKKGLAILNCDDIMIEKYKKRAIGNMVEIHLQQKPIRSTAYKTSGLNSIFDFVIDKEAIKKELWMYPIDAAVLGSWDEQVHIEISNFLLPAYYKYTFASAIMFAISLNVQFGVFMKAVSEYKLPPGRMSTFEGIHNTYLIDSTYNSSRDALEGAIKLLAEFEQTAAILGDMRELGDETEEEHQKVAQILIDNNIDKVFLAGPAMSTFTYNYLIEHDFNKANLYKYTTVAELKKDFVAKKFSQIQSGSIILIKGSQNELFMESIVELLLKDKNKIAYLCRRGRIWDERRINAGL